MGLPLCNVHVGAVSDLDLVVVAFGATGPVLGEDRRYTVSTRHLGHLGREWGHLVKYHTRVALGYGEGSNRYSEVHKKTKLQTRVVCCLL